MKFKCCLKIFPLLFTPGLINVRRLFTSWLAVAYSTVTILTKGKDRSPESNVPRSNVVFSAIKANHSKVNNPEILKGGDIIFPIISQWEISVAMETIVLIQSAPKPYAAFSPPQ